MNLINTTSLRKSFLKPLLLKPLLVGISFLLITLSQTSIAGKVPELKTLTDKNLRNQLITHASRLFGKSNIDKIEIYHSQIPNFYTLRITDQFGLISADGKYFIHGDPWKTKSRTNLFTPIRQHYVLNEIDAIGADLQVSFPAASPKAEIWVFSDVDCFYCRKLHLEMAQLNKLGITVNYLAFPRTGSEDSEAWQKSVKVWCAKDSQSAMTKAKRGNSVANLPQRSSCNPQIGKQYNTGKKLGIQGTPAIVLADGEIIPGYVPAEKLAAQAIAATKK